MKLDPNYSIADADRVEIVRLCRELVIEITYLSDFGETDKAIRLFADSATWLRAGTQYSGLAEIRSSYLAFPVTQIARHLIGTPFVTVTDDAHASSVTYYSAYVRDPGTSRPDFPLEFDGPFTVGEYHDEFVRTSMGWRFASRRAVRTFQNGALR